MRKEHKSVVLREVEVVDSEIIICDCCKKVIFDRDNIDQFIHDRLLNSIKYYVVNTGHDDWGRDSGDSFEEFDLCSDECLRKKLDEFLKEGSYTGFFRIYTNSIDINGTTKDFDINENIYR